MKKFIYSILIFLGIIKKEEKKEEKIYESYLLNDEDIKLFEYINQFRIENGLNLLIIKPKLSDITYSHCKYIQIKNKGSHDNIIDRFSNYPNKKMSEIVAFSYRSAYGAFNGFKMSNNHRKAMIDKFSHIGLSSIKVSETSYAFVVLFLLE